MTLSDKQEDWEKLVRRWEHTKIQANLHDWTQYIVKTSLEPTCRFIFFNIFWIITDIHRNAYGPDHILPALYYDLAQRLYNDDAPPVPESLVKEMPSILSSRNGLFRFIWTDRKNNPLDLSRAKEVMDFLESTSFHDVLTELSLLQSRLKNIRE
jgi:hypothetical protein